MEVIKKVAGGVGPGMFALCMEGALPCQPIWKLASQIAISGNWQALGEAAPSKGQQSPNMSKHQIQKLENVSG